MKLCLHTRNFFLITFCYLVLPGISICQPNFWTTRLDSLAQKSGYVPGSFRFGLYLQALENKRVALVVNHTSIHQGKHLVDTLISSGIQIVKIFAPEHGFRGTAAEGEMVKSGLDAKTGIPIVSLYGKSKKPSKEMLKDVDVVLFDIQDVGARFYTYISTMRLVMEACNENHKQLIIADRFNPLGFCTAGPVMEKKFMSFVGAFPIPIVHGLTIGELAKMAIGEHWMRKGKQLKMRIIPCVGYKHSDTLFPEIPPSPNLTTPISILAYPSLCLFEGTNWSVGRGTSHPFQVFGFPDSTAGQYTFVPGKKDSLQLKPLYYNTTCYGSRVTRDSITACFSLKFIIQAWNRKSTDPAFFNSFFPRLAGNQWLKEHIKKGEYPVFDQTEWLKRRVKYLLYPQY